MKINILISIFAITSLSVFPTRIYGSTDVEEETPKTLPLTNQKSSKSDSNVIAGIKPNDNTAEFNSIGEVWQENDHEVLIRNERGAKNNKDGGVEGGAASCRYAKGAWTDCDSKSNTRSRTLTLKKGEEGCVPTRTIQKKCKKACRYEKGAWSECTGGQMSRTDKLKTTSDSTCQTVRVVNKNCNPAKSKGENNKNKEQRNGKKEKGNRKGRA